MEGWVEYVYGESWYKSLDEVWNYVRLIDSRPYTYSVQIIAPHGNTFSSEHQFAYGVARKKLSPVELSVTRIKSYRNLPIRIDLSSN